LQDQSPHQRASEQEKIASVESDFGTFSSFGVIIFVIVIVQIAVMILLNVYQNSRYEKASNEIATIQSQLNDSTHKKVNNQVNDITAGLSRLGGVLDSRIKWSSFYTQLNTVTPKNVKLNSISVSESGTFKADGITDSMSSLAQLIVAWQKGSDTVTTPFSSVSLGSNGYVVEGGVRKVSFSISGQIILGGLK
jgi:cell division protein FtsL